MIKIECIINIPNETPNRLNLFDFDSIHMEYHQ